ncbi:MAG: DNA translocase FtsK [Planctomycetes bacterium]|nr:DNA translocase FtsK [Planctomycetota bacterium]
MGETFDFRRLRDDLLSLLLLGAVAYLGLSLVSWDAADPPSTQTYPVRAMAHNWGGNLGAYLIYGLRTVTGLGAYFVWLSLLALDVRLFSRREVVGWGAVMFGWSLLLIAVCVGLQLLMPGLGGGQIVGSGGYVGAWGVALLQPLFSKAGLMIVLGSCAASGLLLAGDILLVDAALDCVAAPMWVVNWVAFGKAKRPVKEKPVKPKFEAPLAVRESLPLEEVLSESVKPTSAEEAAGSAVDLLDSMNAEIAAVLHEVESLTAAAVPSEVEAAPTDDSERLPIKVNPPVSVKSDREQVIAQLEAGSQQADGSQYVLPSLEALEQPAEFPYEELAKKAQVAAVTLEKTFTEFGLNVKINEIDTGPVITQFELSLEAGLRLNKVMALENDLAIALRVPAVRVVAPIPGKNTVGVEVPNEKQVMVRLRELIEACPQDTEKKRIPLFLGKDVSGRPMVMDLCKMPHLLIAGRTGTGKSVCLNTLILSILMTRSPDQVRMLMIDPKMVELSPYKRIPHLMHPVITDMKKAEAVLAWAVDKMEERYDLLARVGVRHLDSYNAMTREEVLRRCGLTADCAEADSIPEQMPYIVIVADEMADMMMTSGKDVEGHIIRLAQKSRAVGIHLVLATQKPTVDVITGLIKSNLPARIAFQVASRTDSRVVLDENGADRLLGNGDMLFLVPGTSNLVRAQGTYVSDNEVNRIIDHFGDQAPQYSAEIAQAASKALATGDGSSGGPREKDDLYEPAVEIIIREGRGSVSLLQRHLGIGYGRAARLIDYMAEDGIVGDYNGSQAREVLYNLEQWEAIKASRLPMEAAV